MSALGCTQNEMTRMMIDLEINSSCEKEVLEHLKKENAQSIVPDGWGEGGTHTQGGAI